MSQSELNLVASLRDIERSIDSLSTLTFYGTIVTAVLVAIMAVTLGMRIARLIRESQ